MIKLAVSAVALVIATASAPAPTGRPATRTLSAGVGIMPVAVGQAALVSGDLNTYAGFPAGIELPDGSGYLVSYGVGHDHFSMTGGQLRYSADGLAWSGPWSLDLGFTGLAAETMAQGGRIYGLQTRVGVTGTVATAVTPYFRWSDDNGRTWSPAVVLAGAGTRTPPAAGTWSFYSSSIAVLQNGSILIAGYGRADGHVLVRRSTDRGLTWTLDKDVAPAGGYSPLQEPQLCRLADGRVAMPMRADSPGQRMFLTTRSADGSSWTPVRVINYDASGQPSCREVAPNMIALVYRGWADRADDTIRPMRLAIMGVDQGTWGRGNIEITQGATGRFLYGTYLKKGDGWIVVHGVEGPNGPLAPSAQVWAQPIEFREVPL